jgi:uncharacterized membrane protein
LSSHLPLVFDGLLSIVGEVLMQGIGQVRKVMPLIILLAIAVIASVICLFFAARQTASQDVKPAQQVEDR